MSGVGDIHAITRGRFLALGATSLFAATAGTAFAHSKHGAFSGGDVGIVNFALTLEKIEADFYKRALASNVLDDEVKKVLDQIAKHENEHVQTLTRALQGLGGKADPAPRASFPDLSSQDVVLRTAIELEEMGVSAYNGAATQIQSADVLQAAASIAQVEARHAGALRELAGEMPTVGAFDKVSSGAEADAAVHELTS